MGIKVVVLAAGQGKRMHNTFLPKVLHPLAGKPLLAHVLATAAGVVGEADPLAIVIYGHQGEQLRQTFAEHNIKWVEQKEQLGTGHALQQALPFINDDDQVLVLYGDVPLITPATLTALIKQTPATGLGVLTAILDNPLGYGRIIRNAKQSIERIVEEKDANHAERALTEINTGFYVLHGSWLKRLLPQLKSSNAQGEYYLTDLIALAAKENISIASTTVKEIHEVKGVNDCLQLAELERFKQRQQAENLLRQGVILLDPARLDVRGEVECGQDVQIDVNVILSGKVKMGSHCRIDANCHLHNVTLGDGVHLKANSLLEDCQVDAGCVVGPFARLRPGTHLLADVHVGNFVEIKKSRIDVGSKINHLSYIGDCTMGKRVNVGAGTITCNYDGVNKHQTVIGDDVFIGSDTQLVAPVKIGDGVTIGAGCTITKDAEPQQLILTHKLEQRSVKGWKRSK